MSFSFSLHRWCGTRRWPVWALAIGFVVTPAWSIAAGISFNDAQRLATERAPLLRARQAQIAATQEEAAHCFRVCSARGGESFVREVRVATQERDLPQHERARCGGEQTLEEGRAAMTLACDEEIGGHTLLSLLGARVSA